MPSLNHSKRLGDIMLNVSKSLKFAVITLMLFVVVIVAVGVGSVYIPPSHTLTILVNKLLGLPLPDDITAVTADIVLQMRIPRIMLALISGMGLALSGVMMQSVLRNPLASSFTLGVSSGASLGAGVAILFSVTVFGVFTLPAFGLTAGLLTVFLSLTVAYKLDKHMQNHSIILTGMAFSLFANAMLTIVLSLSKEQMSQLIYWQMGSFSMGGMSQSFVLYPTVLICFLLAMFYSSQMDIMTLGDEQAMTTGVNARAVKVTLLAIGAMLTGTIVSVVGVIGFVDLFTPHVARKIFGSSHRYVLPASALLGGLFMVLCDLISRTVASPIIIPIGAVTSALGAPFFIYLFFSGKKKGGAA